MSDTVSRQAAIDAIGTWDKFGVDERGRVVRWHEGLEPYVHLRDVMTAIVNLPPAQPESTREFVELVAKYLDPELCTYKEYKGKPYYSIRYIKNGEEYEGYSTYSLKVLSQYLKEYFIPSAQPEIIHCRDCIHWKSKEYVGNNDIHTLNLASLPCKNWLTAGDWYCGSAERREE